MNIKNLLLELKLNTSSLLSKIFSLFVKLDIGANESSLLNWIFCLLLQTSISLIGILASRCDYTLLWVKNKDVFFSFAFLTRFVSSTLFYSQFTLKRTESPKRVDKDVDQGRNEERVRWCLKWLKRSLARENLLKARTKILKTAKIVSKERKKHLDLRWRGGI